MVNYYLIYINYNQRKKRENSQYSVGSPHTRQYTTADHLS